METKFKVGEPKVFTIASGADGSAVTPVDLGHPYKVIVVTCEDCQYIPAATTLGAEVGYEGDDGPFSLFQEDGSAVWASGNLPTSGKVALVIGPAKGARRVRLILGNNSTGGPTVFKVRGMDQGEYFGLAP